jgi:hypothetical protein
MLAFSLSIISLCLAACCNDRKYKDAVVVNTDDPINDPGFPGCGWVIQIGSNEFKPINLAKDYQIDQLQVRVKFEVLKSKANCGIAPSTFNEIRLEDIKRK